jgi:hypothetical protein
MLLHSWLGYVLFTARTTTELTFAAGPSPPVAGADLAVGRVGLKPLLPPP